MQLGAQHDDGGTFELSLAVLPTASPTLPLNFVSRLQGAGQHSQRLAARLTTDVTNRIQAAVYTLSAEPNATLCPRYAALAPIEL